MLLSIVATLERFGARLALRIDPTGSPQRPEVEAVGLANPLAVEHVVRMPRPRADAIFQLDGRLAGVGKCHQVTRLRLKFIRAAIQWRNRRGRRPVVVSAWVVPARKQYPNLRTEWRAGYRNIDGAENQIALIDDSL